MKKSNEWVVQTVAERRMILAGPLRSGTNAVSDSRRISDD